MAGRLLELVQRGVQAAGRVLPVPGRLGDGWRVYLMHTTSGQLGPQVSPVSGSWEVELNATESGTVVLRKADLSRIESKWYAPFWGGVLFSFEHDGVERPIIAGPVTGWPTETTDELTLNFAGIRRLFAGRTVTHNDGVTAKRDVVFSGLGLGTIAWECVRVSMAKPGGALPVVMRSPVEKITPGHRRTFEWWNLANNLCDKRLAELSDVIDGPDLMFRPEWADESRTRVVWGLYTGTEASPVIAQQWVPDFDTTAARSQVSGVSIKSAAENMASRVYATGSGEGAGTLVRVAEDFAVLDVGVPLLEAVVSDTSWDKTDLVAAKAAGTLAGAGDVVEQVGFSVRADSDKTPLGSYHVGDAAAVNLAGWEGIPDGVHNMRIVRASGDLGRTVSLEFQEDSW